MRGFFGIGAEGISKAMNLGNLLRSAHAFGASFFFTVAADINERSIRHADTSDAPDHLPVYRFDNVGELLLPRRCQLVGVELTDDAEELPSFYHPAAAAYVVGPERGSLSPEMLARCDRVVKIPMKFCINVGTAGAIVMYDRLLARGRFDRRATGSLGAPEPRPAHVQGGQIIRKRRNA